jgi:methionyl-tRNA formyltransferase
MKICFMGTPEFAVPTLKRILDDGHDVLAVFTQPDKPKGRGMNLAQPPVKELALTYKIPVYQPKTLKDKEIIYQIKSLDLDLIVVVAYGKILPKEILELPRYGCINVHASLLPKYRGAAPIQWSIINGEKETGITTMMMDEGLDTGDMLLKSVVEIENTDTALTLHNKLSLCGADLLSKTIKLIENNDLIKIPQDHSEFTYAPTLNKSLCKIDFKMEALKINNLIRGLNPWPVAIAEYSGKKLKIYSAEIINETADFKFTEGELISDSALIIGCGKDTVIKFLEVQLEGKKKMQASEFLRGHKIKKGTIFS